MLVLMFYLAYVWWFPDFRFLVSSGILMTRFENRVQFQGSRREKILEGTKLGQMECTEVLRPWDGLPEHFGI